MKVALLVVAGVHGDVSPRTPATCIAATTPELIIGILNSLFFKNFLNFLIFKDSVTLARYRHTL